MALNRRRRESAAFILPFVGAVLIVPPVLSVFQTGIHLFGIPMGIVYLFAVWLGLVVATAWLAGRLGGTRPPTEDIETDRP